MSVPPLPELIYQHGEETEIVVREYAIAAYAAGRNAGISEQVKVSIPTDTMEQEFQKHYRFGYAAGRLAGLEVAARLVELEYAADKKASDRLKQIAKHIRALDA